MNRARPMAARLIRWNEHASRNGIVGNESSSQTW